MFKIKYIYEKKVKYGSNWDTVVLGNFGDNFLNFDIITPLHT